MAISSTDFETYIAADGQPAIRRAQGGGPVAPDIGTTMTIEQITPKMAEEYLATASPNRETRRGKIDQYARDMNAGNWHSSVIRFDRAEKLVDGQHRLWAVVVSGTAQLFYVERGLEPEAVRTIDSGISRTLSDVLAVRGENNAVQLASAIRYARWIERNPGIAPSGQSKDPFSPDEVVEYLDANPLLRDHVRITKMGRKQLPSYGSMSLAGALRFLESKINPQLATEFWDQMFSGAEMKSGTGPHTLRNHVINDRLYVPRMSINELAAISIKAWNYWQYGFEIKRLRWQRGEIFPVLGQKPKP